MKKSIRILSILMAFAMLIGSFSVMGNAYQAYKDSAVSYNDVDAPEFTTEQYASMGLDEVDRMLAKEKIELDIYIGKLDLASIDTTLASVISLVGSVQNLLPLLGDAEGLKDYVLPIETIRRSNSTDVEVIKALFDFIANLAPLGQKYVNGTVSLGIMNSFIADFIFDVRELAIGLIFGLTEEGKAMGELDENGEPEGFDYFDDGGDAIPEKYTNSTNGVLTLAQTLINNLVLGEWKQLDPYFDDPYSVVNYNFYGFKTDKELNETKPDTKTYDYYGWVHPSDWVTVGLGGYKRVTAGTAAPAADYSLLDIGAGKIGYDFIEDLLRAAYNNLLIPVLNRDTVRWVREDLCGVTYLEEKSRRTLFGDDPNTDVVEGEGDVPAVWYNNPQYEPSYTGEEVTDEILAELQEKSVFAKMFKLQTALELKTEDIPETTTVVDYFNTLLGHVLEEVAVKELEIGNVTYTWYWDYGTNPNGDNSLLFENICRVGKFILQVSGSEFFGQTAFKEEFPTAAEIGQMNNQQIVSLLVRGILNSSVDYIYVEEEYQTLVDVGYRAVEQLAYQDIPQFTYTKPDRANYGDDVEAYYADVVDKMITILFDIAVYNLNQGMDMVPASGNDPVNAEGLLQYQGDEGHYSNLLVQIAAWAFSDYAPLLSVCDNLVCYNAEGSAEGLTEDMVWQDLDTIIDALIPIKGGQGKAPWIAAEIAGNGEEIVSKAFIFDYLLKPIYTLDATNLAVIFKRNPTGAFASMDGVAIIINILENVFDLLFPDVFQAKDSLDQIVNNELLGAMISDLLKSLGTKTFTSSTGATIEGRANDIILVGLPIVCMVLGLSDDQEFEEMEIYLPETIAATGDLPTFEVVNGSSGINTFHTAANGDTTQDQLYKYVIDTYNVNTYNAAGELVQTLGQRGLSQGLEISGGDSVNVTLTGTRAVGDILEFTVNYFILGEDGEEITTETLSKTVYAYVGTTDEDDNAITLYEEVAGRELQYEDSIYLSNGDDLTDIESYNIRIKDNDGGQTATASVTGVSMVSSELANAYPFVTMNPGTDDSKPISQTMTGQEGVYFFSPFAVAEKSNGELYERFEQFYKVNEETGELELDENEEPIPDGDNGGVEDGQYDVNTTISVAGTPYTFKTTIHLYNDYGLDGMFNRAVSANRQFSNYDNVSDYGAAATLWADYKVALMNAARLVLMPKEGDDFASKIEATKEGYDNRYEELAEELEAAIEALDKYTKDTGITGLQDAIREVSGINYTTTTTRATTSEGLAYTIITKEDIEYWEDGYVHFGMRDYVPHTYNRYKDARRLAEGIINSQEFFAPEDPRDREYYVPTNEEIQEYNEAMNEYIARRLDLPAVNSIEATYAIHMIELTSSRLIRVAGNTSKLQMVYDKYAGIDTTADDYIGESADNYNHAVEFAAEVLAASDPRPSEINEATTQLVYTWKHLAPAGDYKNVAAALAQAKPIVDANGEDPSAQFMYTEASYRAFLEAYNEALRANTEKPYSEDEQDTIEEIAQNLIDALELEPAGSAGGAEPVIDFVTEDPYMYFDHDYAYSFVPRVSEGSLNHGYYYATLTDGTPVDGYVVGYGVGMYDEATVLAAFNMENCTAEVTPGGDAYSTGTVIKFFDNEGTLVKTYIVVVIGDVNGDGVYDGGDKIAILNNAAYNTDWEWGGTNEEYKAAAGDITNEGMLDGTDATQIDRIAAYQGTINQEVASDGSSSFLEA
ncbi:MAG: hypothetical protein IJE72_01605 [Clostridia bacterium]|nr:hypothetical protein [Clostridia bacterium]